jgi:quercetin dioxygenase-like cupin family protein
MRKLRFYRATTLILLILLALVTWRFKQLVWQIGDFGAAHETWVVDLPDRVRIIEAAHGGDADFSETYLSTSEGSVHLHAMGHRQLTPLHLHPASDEVTVIASGTAKVTHVVHSADAGVVSQEHLDGPGSVIASPRNTAHEWSNPSGSQMLFNVVFTSPKFSGNFYVHPDDARIGDSQPVVFDSAMLAEAGAPNTPVRLPIENAHFWTLRVTSSWSLPSSSGAPVMAWVLAGHGSVDGRSLKPGSLAHLESLRPLQLRTTSDAPLTVLLFDVSGELLGP